jgi:hypothetical protein
VNDYVVIQRGMDAFVTFDDDANKTKEKNRAFFFGPYFIPIRAK